MFFGQQKDRQSFRDIVLGPGGDLWRGVLVEFDETLEFFVGVSEIFGVEDVSQVLSDLFSQVDFGDMVHCVLHQVKLATLPRDTWHDRFPCGLESFMGVADDELHSVHSTLLEGTEEFTPMDFGFGK